MKTKTSKTVWAGRVISGLASFPFLMSAGMKFAGGPEVVQSFERLGWRSSMILPLGVLELACVAIYLVPATSVLGAILLAGYMGGAIATHVRVGEPPMLQVVIGVLVWLGLFLREKRLGELLPLRGKDFLYEREIVIERPRAEVFAYLRPLSNFKAWNPFLRKDPNAALSSRGVDGQVGYVAAWKGNREMGAGEQEVTRIIDGERIEFELRFFAPFSGTNQGYFSAESVSASQTRVRWGMSGKMAFPMTMVGLFVDCDKMIAGEFEWGLGQLKSKLEQKP